ncbi:phosphoesterase PA-phosphatase related protein [Solidesulfovibrio fructosivorans JJ]]|uniref:Acid phosphatase n=1 Tax=Solidesulfovibrio fructosivorans JJ] TaxID=596151 RepID=E1JSG9_SOLFR|nr:phosphatase PAP2 family protein [Solidesulfovibrio fructosivorans]EFL52938.1 phosphoesterase PA-phosphatase related protein [Solidesulfovibrio fructosivorans JJ]]
MHRTRTYRLLAALLLLLLVPQTGLAKSQAFGLTAQQIDFVRLLPPPPVVGSAIQRAEMRLLMTLQKSRTPEQVALAQADAKRTVFRFTDAIGPAFTADNLPLTAAFFDMTRTAADALIGPAKAHFDRPRPYVTNPDLTPCLPKPHNASYPSGHSTFATVTSIILANMLPEHADAIYARAEVYRFNRELGGVHYPSDVAAGRIAGTVIAAFLFDDPVFMEAYARARAETRRVLGLPQ